MSRNVSLPGASASAFSSSRAGAAAFSAALIRVTVIDMSDAKGSSERRSYPSVNLFGDRTLISQIVTCQPLTITHVVTRAELVAVQTR